MFRKVTAKTRVQRALARLDKAIQKWFDVNDPNNKERYATMHIRTYEESKIAPGVHVGRGHVSRVTLKLSSMNNDSFYMDICSPLDELNS